jgi:hypothetical protein
MEHVATLGLEEIVETMVHELVTVQRVVNDAFINLPFIYPSGASVTVKVTPHRGFYRVSDAGFAFREIEAIGAERSFPGVASPIITASDLKRDASVLFADVDKDCLFRAICDVGMASWQIADRIYARASEESDDDVEEYLRTRLEHIFGAAHVHPGKMVGASTSEWDVTAIVERGGKSTVFQAVAPHANSVYRTNSAFHDLAALDNAPKLVAVVRDKTALGARLALLAQAGRIIEDKQPDDVYERAAA